jgi:uncharacterized protein YnzC (UPF0291/DUF896 family)
LNEVMIKRINELAKKKKNEGLTPEELNEQKELYALYLRDIRKQVKTQLDARVKPVHHTGCDCCGDHHHH